MAERKRARRDPDGADKAKTGADKAKADAGKTKPGADKAKAGPGDGKTGAGKDRVRSAAAPPAPRTAKAERPSPGPAPAPRSATFPLGVDYWPLDDEVAAFSDWYAGDVDADFAVFAEAGLTLVRVFISWKYFEQQVGIYDEEASQRLARLVASARDHGLRLIVCFFADDRLAELCDVTWGRRRDPRTDPYLVQREASLVQRVVSLHRSEQAIFAWDLANEAYCAGFKSAAALESWVRALREAIREVDPDRPILVGADPETMLRATGIDPRDAIDECEVAVSHVTASYAAYAADGPVTSGAATYLDSFLLRSAGRGVPVLVDGAGVRDFGHDQGQEAAYLRMVLYGSIMNRGAGVLLRRWRDVKAERREPYFADPYEVLVGVVDAQGEPKPSLAEVARFARVAGRLDLRRYALQPERVAVLVPAERYETLPSLAGLYGPRACLAAYVSAKEAHVPVGVVREGDDLSGYGVLIVPSVGRLLQGTWRGLAGFVQGGGSLIASYAGGDVSPAVREIFGVEFLGDYGARDTLSCRVAQPDALGPLVSFDARMTVGSFALLAGSRASIVATDGKGSPFVTLHGYGSGRAIYVAAPLERAIAQGDARTTPAAVRHMLRCVYGAAARSAGAALPLTCDTPEVELALFGGDDDDILLLLNHAPEALTATLTTDRRVASVADARGGRPTPVGGSVLGVPLEANGAASLRVVWE